MVDARSITASVLVATLTFACETGSEDATTSPEPHGAQLYALHCSPCHSPTGRGEPLPAPGGEVVISRDLSSPEFQEERSDEELLRMINQGLPPWMPSFDDVLSDEELREVVSHVRKLGKQRVK